jgi:hypothetical protein
MDFTYEIRYLGFGCPLKVCLSVGPALCWDSGVTSLVHLGWADSGGEIEFLR